MNHDAIYQNSKITRQKIKQVLSSEEWARVTQRSDWMGAWAVLSNWVLIAFAFFVTAWGLSLEWWLAIPVVALGLSLLGGRQLALAICSHDASHRTLFKTRWFNDRLVSWLCAHPIGLDLKKYREHHFIHHAKTGTDEDTDISLVKGLPTTRASLLRKFLRDLAGITGVKFLFGRFLMDAELVKWTVANDIVQLPRKSAIHHASCFMMNFYPTLLANISLYLVLSVAGHPELYLAWIIAYIVPYPLFLRIRSLAEHAGMERCVDMFRNTRTTRAGLVARTFVAPLNVNFHQEHHAMAAAPWHRLPEIHRLFRERGIAGDPPTYRDVMRIVSSVPTPV